MRAVMKFADRSCRAQRSRALPRISGLAAVLIMLSGAAIARAQQPEAAAEALFRAGRDATRQGDALRACDRYRESYRLEPALGTLFNIASCELSLGQLSEAWRHFQDVAHALPANDPRLPIANDRLAELDRRLPRLTIARAAGAPADLELWIGDVQLGAASFGVPLPMDPGHYTIKTRCPGHEVGRYEVELAEGQQRALEVDAAAPLPSMNAPPAGAEAAAQLEPRRAAIASDAAARDDGARVGTRRGIAYALIGAGAASLAASAVCAALALDRLALVRDNCDAQHCNARGLAARQSGEAFFFGSLVALGVSLASAGASTYLLMTAHDREVATPAPKHVEATAAASPRFVVGALRMRFE